MITPEEQKANRKKWVEALRSGKYKQGTRRLSRNDTYCCLGVLCEISNTPVTDAQDGREEGVKVYEGSYIMSAPPTAIEFVDLSTRQGAFQDAHGVKTLTQLNDDGKTFEEIADIIEAEPDGLFTK